MKKTVITLIAAIIIIALIGSGVWYLQNSRNQISVEMESITVGMSPNIDSAALIIIADDQHYFADNGLNVTIKDYDVGLRAVNGMLNNENDIAIATEFVLVEKVFDQEKIYGFASIAKYEDKVIIGRSDHGIKNVSDLKGKKIGVDLGTNTEFILGRFLELHGFRLDDVTLVDIKRPQFVDAIGNGSVDAIIVWGLEVSIIKDQLGPAAVTWPAQSGQQGHWLAMCRQDWAGQHPDMINRFLKSIDQAATYTVYHPEQAKAIARKRLPADDVYLETIWSNTQFSLSLDQSLITAMEDEGRWMIKNNLTDEKTIPDYRYYLYREGLDQIKPESVNLIR
ncbi:ABC transporter substrate-binding protein [Methanooceanicella nereidis]|nr:ABC transporter substrate-binding protein [Methanocella sp. CWC-04]